MWQLLATNIVRWIDGWMDVLGSFPKTRTHLGLRFKDNVDERFDPLQMLTSLKKITALSTQIQDENTGNL